MPPKIGKYKVLGTLGKGAMGEVYLGEDPYIGRRVAIKVMRDADPAAAERFQHEARIIGGFSHPHIVLLLEFGFEGPQPYLVMEYLEGQSLEQWMRAPHSLREELELMHGLCGALAYAHARGVLHRDIKPANVQVLPDGRCKLMDFGIARASSAHLTATGTVMGTPNYMAPEIARDAAYSERSDLYSLAVVFYELLSGRNPFVAQNLAACLHNVLYVVPPPLGSLRGDLPAPLAGALDACLSKDPAQRLASVAALGERIGAELAGTTGGAGARAPLADGLETQAIARPAPEPARRRRLGLAAGVVALVSALAGLVWVMRRATPVAEPTAAPGAMDPSAPVPGPFAPPQASAGRPVVAASTAASPTPTSAPPARPAQRASAGVAGPPVPPPTAAPVVAPTPTPIPAATAAPPSVEVARTAAPTPVPAAGEAVPTASLMGLKPRVVRLGASVQIEISGRDLRPELKVEVWHGRRRAPGIRVLKQRFEAPTRIVVTLLVDGDAAIDTYSLVLTDAAGGSTNSLPLEVAL